MRSWLVSAGALVVVLAGMSAVPAAAAAGAPSALYAGHSLTARTAADRLVSSSGEFTLAVFPAMVDLMQVQRMASGSTTGTDVWIAQDAGGGYQSDTDRSRLVMQTDGNLVLYTASGHALWSSGTRGTGSRNHIVMANNGDVIMYDAGGREVWSTRTTGILLASGHELLSGGRMIARWLYETGTYHVSILAMEPSGNLVLYCGSRVAWSTHTSVAGSHLTMGRTGNLAVVTPAGHLAWQSHTGYLGAASWMYGVTGVTIHAEQHPLVNVTPVASNCR